MNQAYSRLSTTHDHITDCKLDSVVYAGVSVVIFMWTGFVWAERSTPDNFRSHACTIWKRKLLSQCSSYLVKQLKHG